VKLLALDTSTECCSAALLARDALTLREALTERGHAELILPYVESLLRDAGLVLTDLDAIAFGRGPGAFTGLRIAAGVTQGLAYAAGLRVVAVSSLAAVAERVPAAPDERILVCNDARMGELYFARFARDRDGSLRTLDRERVGSPEAVLAAADAAHVGGNGLVRHQDLRRALAARGLAVHDLHPRADAVARLGLAGLVAGEAVTAEAVRPVYLRDEVATAQTGPVTPLQ
jgi:tRNA threonylcarbamoyladenosine biosynthesis protein TsaB